MGIFTNEYGELKFGVVIPVIGVVIGTVVGGCCSMLNSYDYSSGSRAGMVNRVARKGLIWKTHEGQMALEGIVSGGESMGANVWEFSIDNQTRHGENVFELSKKLNDALESGQKVKVNYISVIGGWPWRGSTNNYIQSVEPIVKVEK
ncbi:MAG: hypothetical protein AABW48_06460 [Nanoarchaeota archaeon]